MVQSNHTLLVCYSITIALHNADSSIASFKWYSELYWSNWICYSILWTFSQCDRCLCAINNLKITRKYWNIIWKINSISQTRSQIEIDRIQCECRQPNLSLRITMRRAYRRKQMIHADSGRRQTRIGVHKLTRQFSHKFCVIWQINQTVSNFCILIKFMIIKNKLSSNSYTRIFTNNMKY